MAGLLCVGEIVVEMVADEVDQVMDDAGHWVGPFPSGAPAILADQAALCGAQVSMVGTVGADAFGEACVVRLRASGVNVDRVRIEADGTTGVAFVRYRSDGSRSFIFHLADSASGRFRVDDPPAALSGVDCVHLMGSSAFSVSAVKAITDVFDAAVDRGIPVSFDPNIRPEMLTRSAYAAALRRILNGARLVFASEGELPALLDGVEEEQCARQLLSQEAEVVVIKRGAKGASLYLPDGSSHHVPGRAVKEVDPTGAGDCFGGTFLALYLQGRTAEQALHLANIAGGRAVTARGPMSGNTTLAELEAAQ